MIAPRHGWPPIRTARLRLRDYAPPDFEDVHRYASDPRVTAALCWGPNTPDQTRAFLAQAKLEAEGHPRLRFSLGIESSESHRIIGGVHIHPHPGEPAVFAIGYCLEPTHWGRGLGSEVAAGIVRFGFEQLDAKRLVAEAFLSNTGSERILRCMGFRPGEPFERRVACRGERHQARLFTLDKQDWLKRHP